ncbi:MAG: hypothetical protein LBS46_03500 [Dysgonamonadaceae bacterium]|jgi:hypothetical protein|nr:hypothetical protein [Dysgonamonadaceae bacterium]
MKTTLFNFNRFGLLFRRYFTERLHTEVIYWSIMIIAFLFLRNFIFGIGFLFFVAGAFYAARFFREIHSSTNGVAFFMIPATQFEKTVMAIIMTTFYYFWMMTASYTIGNLLGTLLNNTLASVPFIALGYMELNELFYRSPLQWVLFETPAFFYTMYDVAQENSYSYFGIFSRVFLLLQSIFLLGGIYFKNNQAFKTFFVTSVIPVLFFIVFVLEMRLIAGSETAIAHVEAEDFFHIRDIFVRILNGALCLLPPFFWVVCYFRLTEKQV